MSTKLGLHVTTGSRNGYGDVVATGPAVVLAVNEGGALTEAKAKGGERVITIFRIFRDDIAFLDAPPNIDHMSVAEAQAAADHYWPELKTIYDMNPADFYQPVNETGGDNPTSLRNIIAFEMRLLELAERDGYKLAVGSPAGGSPGSWELWVQFYLPLIRRAAEGGHIYSRHAYGGVASPHGSGLLTTAGPAPADDNAGRPFREALFLREQGIHTPMVITETGQNGGFQFPGTTAFMEDVARYDQLCQEHDNIWGFCLWTYGNYQNRPANIEKASKQLADYVRQKGGAKVHEYPTFPVTVPPTAGDQAEAAGFIASVDLDAVRPGMPFQATWTFLNSGASTWDSGYKLVYTSEAHPETAAFSRSPMGSTKAYSLTAIGAPSQVQPGETVSLTVPLTAPSTSGTHATNWRLRTPGGQLFGPIRWLRAEVSGAPVTVAGDEYAYQVLDFRNSIVNFNNVLPGQQFSGTWTLLNSGTRPWSGDFRVAYLNQGTSDTQQALRDLMGAKPSYKLRKLTGRDQVNPGETVTISLDLVAPHQPGVYAFHWQLKRDGQAFGGIRWLIIGVQSVADQPTSPTAPLEFQPGMNVNPDAHPPDVERLRGLRWVRFVYKASAKHRTVDQAFQEEYRNLIQSYTSAGIKCLLILNQETEWGNEPWKTGGWGQYATSLARAARRIAELCVPFGEMVAYQIWNEEDSGEDNPSAIGVAADNFALVLGQTAGAIRQVAPQATVVIGGLNTGPDNAVAYVRRIQQQLNGELPVNALAYHPYGRFVHNDPFYNQQFGTLPDALRTFKQAYPQMPLWITEIGVADNNPIGPEHYEKIANYMREFFAEVADNHAKHVPVLIWFAWSDLMRNAGITTVDGKLKPRIGDAFREMVARGQAEPFAIPFAQPGLGGEADSEFLRFSTTLQDYNAVPAGSTFTNRWVFKNTGGTTWSEGYRLVYAPEATGDNDPLMAKTSYPLADLATLLPARPGDEVEIKLDMTAPARFGRHIISRWELRDPANVSFGHLYAEITVVPAVTVGTNVRSADMVFIADQTIPDGTPFQEGTAFHKQWRVRNTGNRHWGSGFRLNFVEGNLQMARGIASHVVPPATKGEEVILSVPMTAPPAVAQRPTTYISSWRLQDDRGNFFGEPIWAKIISNSSQLKTSFGRFRDTSGWYSQKDPRWLEQQLGHGQQTIGSWGCLLTCYAMMLTAYGLRFSPAELNQRLKEHEAARGFNGSSVQFIAPATVLQGLIQGSNLRSWPTSDVPATVWQEGIDPIQRIDTALANGDAVIAQVDFQPIDSNIDQHWVIIVQRTPEGDDYLILDPIVPADQVQDQPRSLMQKYGNPDASRTHENNLRNAIKSALVYRFNGQMVGG